MTSKRRHSDSTHAAIKQITPHAIHVAAHSTGPTAVRVVKIGGRAQGDESLTARILEAVRVPGARVVVVHGGGDEVSALQRQMGVPWRCSRLYTEDRAISRPSAPSNSALIWGTTRMPPLRARSRNGAKL